MYLALGLFIVHFFNPTRGIDVYPSSTRESDNSDHLFDASSILRFNNALFLGSSENLLVTIYDQMFQNQR